MKHTFDELVAIAHHYYPRDIEVGDPAYRSSAAYQRLVASRIQAGTGGRKVVWNDFLERAQVRFPSDQVNDDSSHLATGKFDACYSGAIFRKKSDGSKLSSIGFLISFVAPFYLVFSAYKEPPVPDPEREAQAAKFPIVILHDTAYCVSADHPLARLAEPVPYRPVGRRVIRFDFGPGEAPYADWLSAEIERTWDVERLPPEIGHRVVPNVATENRQAGEATLFDCLFAASW